MKKLAFLLLFIFAFSCQGTTNQSKTTLKCENSTLLAKGKGFEIRLSDYRYVQTLLNPKAKKYFSSHKQDLLNRIINRKVVLRYVIDSGLAKKYGIDKQMQDFKERYLSRLYVSKLASKMAGRITEKEIKERFKELFPKKSTENMTGYDRAFIRNEIFVKKYDKAVQKIYRDIREKIKLKGNVATYDGISVELDKKLDPKRRLDVATKLVSRKYFYNKAVSEGLNKDKEFQRAFNGMYEMKAKAVFLKEISKGITVSDDEAKKYYEEHKDEFSMPERAKAVVFLVKSEKKAKEIEKELEKKSWKKVAREYGKFRLKPKTYFKGKNDPIGTLIFLTKKKLLVAQVSEGTFAVIKVLERLPEKRITYADAAKYIKLRLKREKSKEKLKEKLDELRKTYNVKIFEQNLVCL